MPLKFIERNKVSASRITLDYRLNAARIVDGLTQSELGTLDDCKMKWNLSYNNLLTKMGVWNWPIEVGSAFHVFAEDFYRKGKDCDPNTVTMEEPDENVIRNAEFEELWEHWHVVLAALQRAYAQHYADDLLLIKPDIIEEVVVREYRGFTFTGKIDLTGTMGEQYFMLDHKSTSNLEALTEDGWDFKLQFQFYPWLLQGKEEPKKFIINGIKRPALRITKTETRQAFANRCAADIKARPLEYFRRTSMPINPTNIEWFQKTVLDPKIDFMLTAKDNPNLLLNKNTNVCRKFNSTCPFLPVCRNGFELEESQYTQRKTKHVELTK